MIKLKYIFLKNFTPVFILLTTMLILWTLFQKKQVSRVVRDSDVTIPVICEFKEKKSPKEILLQMPSYDYKNILSLLDRFKVIEKAFYCDLKGFISNLDNIESLKKILDKLILEQASFKKYLKQIKRNALKYKVTIKSSSFTYYSRVIKDKISIISGMIDKLNLIYS